MSFAAMTAWQAWLVMAVAVAVAVWLFLLKLKPPRIAVPSIGLWRRVLDEARQKSLWERIRKAVSLAAAILITLAIALAVLRPQRSVQAVAGARTSAQTERIAIVLDSSWSMMAATSSGQTRWDRAVARAREIAASAAGDDIVLCTTADGVVEGPTADVALIEAALDRVTPSGAAASLWPRVEGAGATYFLTDGAVARPLETAVTIESVFEAAPNVAITAFDVRRSSAADVGGQAFLEIANYAASTQDVRVTLTRGMATILDIHIDLAAGTAVQRIVSLTRGGDAKLRAHVEAKSNALAIDDDAVAWVPGSQPLAVTVVSEAPENFGPFLSKDPEIKPTFVLPKNYAPGQADVVIFDRVLPDALPTVPALFVAPPAAPKLKTSAEPIADPVSVSEDAPEWLPRSAHRILQGVDTQTMALDRGRVYNASGLEAVAASEKGTPLVFVRDAVDQRFAVFTFSVADSKLMYAPGFPVLLGNAIDWLAHPTAESTRHPGPIAFEEAVATVTGPDGKPVATTKIADTIVASLTSVGFYDITAGGAKRVIAVNASDPSISDLQRTRLAASARTGAAAGSRGRPWWLFAAGFALVLIAVEWFTWQRRITV